MSTLKSFAAADKELYINSEAFVQMGGEYIFSRFALSNAEALGMELAGVYGTDGKPYAVYVYALSRSRHIGSCESLGCRNIQPGVLVSQLPGSCTGGKERARKSGSI